MPTIPDELNTFKNSVDNNIESMNSKITDISTKLTELKNSSSTASSGFSTYYNSKNKDKIINKFTKLGEILTKVSNSVEQDLKSMVSKADEILKKVKRMEELNIEIGEQDSIISREDAKANDNDDATIPDYGARSTAVSVKTNDEREFNTLVNEATSLLSALKGMDANLEFVTSFTSNDYLSYLDSLQYGTYETKTFTYEGRSIEYAIYVPDYGQEVEKLPCMLYMHGGSNTSGNGDWRSYGLNSFIKNQEITPSGVVIMPHITNFNDLEILKALTDSVVEEYNCDTNKISISGHSYGGITTYNMISAYPDYFSCALPISGTSYNKITDEAFSHMKVWAFGGTSEGGSGNCSSSVGKQAVQTVNSLGGEAIFTDIHGGHSDANRDVYNQEHESPDGEMINPIEWAFRQEKA